jgi:hypothetical protein
MNEITDRRFQMIEHERTGMNLQFKDSVTVKGILRYTVFKNRIPVETVEDHNLIVNGAFFQLAHLLGGDVSGREIGGIAFGTNGTNPVPADSLITNRFAKDITGVSYPHQNEVCFDWNLLVTENNGMAILEFGLLTADGTLFSRRIRESKKPIYKESDISLEGQWTIIFN